MPKPHLGIYSIGKFLLLTAQMQGFHIQPCQTGSIQDPWLNLFLTDG